MTRMGHVYGPVPSRRLGRSLGIDLVPFKTCSYDCIYCQLGRTTHKTVERREYIPVDAILAQLEQKLAGAPRLDYIGLAGSGEPTLHAGIGRLILEIKRRTSTPVAVLTNGSLLGSAEVRDQLMEADLVLPSLDAGDARMFEAVNRPHPSLRLDEVVEGTAAFTRSFRGEVWLEVFLLVGMTGVLSEARKIAALVEHIGPARVQLNTVHRPPAEVDALAVPEGVLSDLLPLFPGKVESILPRAPQVPAHSRLEDGDVLRLLARRPCTALDVAEGLDVHVHEALKHLEQLVAAGRVGTVVRGGQTFYGVADGGAPGA